MLHLPVPAPNCIRCEGNSFGLKTIDVHGTNFFMAAICCMKCGGVVSVGESQDNNAMLLQQNEAIKRIAAKLGVSVDLALRA